MSKQYNSTYIDSVIECVVEELLENINGRYLLKVKLKNNATDTLTIIMMNPSKGNEFCSDDTIDKVSYFVFQMNLVKESLVKNIGVINFVNIFPVCKSDYNELGDIMTKIISAGKLVPLQKRNKSLIDKALSESENVVLAWGDVPKNVDAKNHNHEVGMIYSLLVKHRLLESTYVLKFREYDQLLTNKKRPRHPGRKTPICYCKIIKLEFVKKFLYISL